jgi:hypothetical protein
MRKSGDEERKYFRIQRRQHKSVLRKERNYRENIMYSKQLNILVFEELPMS